LGTDYRKGLFKQLQETIEQVEKLTAEICEIKTVHQIEIASLKSEIESLRKENIALKTENEKLKSIINKNSSNSSKPPSTDGFKKIHNSREQTGRKPGGQFGHKGKNPTLYKNPTTIINHKQEKCSCGGTVVYAADYQAKQLVDLDFKVCITEHRSYTGYCECCNEIIKNENPETNIIRYGVEPSVRTLKAFVAMLSSEGLVSINRIKTMLFELTSGVINLSEGTIAKWYKDLSDNLAPFIEEIKEKLLSRLS
jgi:regulator of replication initiation timing